VIDYFRAFERSEAAVDHAINDWQKSFDFFAAVDQLDDNREVGRNLKSLGSVKTTGFSKAHWTSENRCASQMHLASFQHNRFVERQTVIAVILSDENAKEDSFSWNFHSRDDTQESFSRPRRAGVPKTARRLRYLANRISDGRDK
jgi:hypothetical protein